jgi:hypothetical protein
MARWITFDHETSYELLARLPSAAVVESLELGVLERALQSPSAIVILPVSDPNKTAIAVFRKKMSITSDFAAKPVNIRPGGFLGLSDELVFEEEEPSAKKGWWRRLWE